MKRNLLKSPAFKLSSVLFAICLFGAATGCRSTTDTAPTDSTTPTSTMKEGAGKMGEGIGDVAKGAVQGVKEGVCPVVGVRTLKVFYTQSDKGYESILKGEKTFSKYDNRECFMSAENAAEAGYKRAGENSAR